jgi:biotin transport system permease protein
VALGVPYSYHAKRSSIHRLNAGVKLLCLFVFSAAAFFLNPVCSLVLSVALVVVSLRAGVSPAVLFRGCRPIVILASFVVLGRALDFASPPSPAVLVFSLDGFLGGLMFLWGMLLSFCAGALLFSVTTAAEMRGAVCGAERVLFRPVVVLLKNAKSPFLQRIHAVASYPRLGLALGLMLGFIPRFFAEWDVLKTAYRARAGRRGLAEVFCLIPVAAGRMIDKAAETAIALESRGSLL